MENVDVSGFVLQLISAVGGGIGISLIILKFAKGLVQKSFETAIEAVAEKSMAKYSNLLQRRTTAYELLLEKEIDFYNKASSILSELIVDIQDFTFHLGVSKDHPDMYDYKRAKETALKILKCIPEFKKDSLMAHTYIPDNIDDACIKLIHNLQAITPCMYKELKAIRTEENAVIDGNKIRKNEELILMDCALINTRIKNRLEELSKE